MTTTYRFGYGSLRLTLAQLEGRRTWFDLHPEIRRRLICMFDVAVAEGSDLGIGEGARDPLQQELEFFRRHTQVASGGCCSYQGKRWALKAGMAPIAPPGNSNHEKGVLDGFALAADLVGWEDHWFDANCHRFGLKNFGGAIGPGVNGEEWHAQPVEFANSRSAVNVQVAAGVTLSPIPLPGDPPDPKPPTQGEIDMILLKYVKPGDTSGAWTGMITTGTQLAHVINSYAWSVPVSAGVSVVETNDAELDGLIASSQTTTPPPPEFSAARQAAWNIRRG